MERPRSYLALCILLLCIKGARGEDGVPVQYVIQSARAKDAVPVQSVIKGTQGEDSVTVHSVLKGTHGENQFPVRFLSTGHVLEGSRVQTPSGQYANVFLGVPFAEPPVGQLRFQKTRPLEPLLSPQSVSCREYKPSCWQNHSAVADERIKSMSEDCLYLNVFSGLDCETSKLCPVLYYIHGGAFEFDSPTMFSVDVLVDNFASRGIVLVTVPYRLGALGFWSTGGPEAPGNNGIYDVLEGLHWVQREIKTFGGDPGQVTIMGQSSGAASVSLLTLTPKSEGLFHRAVLMSRAPLISDDLDPYRDLAKELGCATDKDWADDKKSQQIIDCMRNIDAKHMIDTYWALEGVSGKHLTAPRIDGPDGLFPVPLPLLIKHRRKIDAIVGTTADENSFVKLISSNATAQTISELCKSEIGSLNLKRQDLLVAECERRYVATPLRESEDVGRESSARKFNMWAEQAAKFQSDIFYFSPAFDEAISLVRAGGRVFVYSFDYVKRGLEGVAPWHAFDLTYVLGIHPFEFDDRDHHIQSTYATFFANFVKHGHPTPSPDRERTPEWKPLRDSLFDMHYMSIDAPTSIMRPRYHYDAVLFWNYIVPTVGERDEGRERGHDVIRSYQPVVPEYMNRVIRLGQMVPEQEKTPGDHTLVTTLSVLAAVVALTGAALSMYTLWTCQKPPSEKRWWRKASESDQLIGRIENGYQTI